MICEGFARQTEKKKKKKRERKGKQSEKSWDFGGAIEFNYLIETSKAFFSPLG